MPVPAATLPPRLSLRAMAMRAGVNQLACLVISVVLWLFGVGTLFETLVFAFAIGNCCWLFIDLGRMGVTRWLQPRQVASATDWPGWGWMGPVIVAGATLGYLAGNTLAARLLGVSRGHAGLNAPILAFSVVAALTISYVFYARERLHRQQLHAQAAERLASDVQLKLLQSQLEPHMLFNTLANLRVLIELDPPQAQGMLDHLIAFLRSTLASTRVDAHPLAAEFQHLHDYLALMSVRMGARLRTRLDLADELRELPVPPLLLQPLVENAVRHGLEPQLDGGLLAVRAERVGTLLRLTVRDTGAGLSGPSPGGTHFGLEQVRRRLHALYGGRARLELHGATDADGGTEAIVTLPLA